MSKIKRFFRRKSLLRNIIVGILIFVTIGAAVGGVVALTRNTDKIDEVLTYESIGWTKYSIGGLAPSNGSYMSTDQSIYTEKSFECQGLNVTPVFDSDVSYQIYFYDQNNKFVHTTGRLTGTFVQDSVPFFAKYARIVITPNDDNKVTFFEKSKYAKQLVVKVYREQGFKNYTEDLFVEKYAHGTLTTIGDVAGTIAEDANASTCVSDYINISSYNDLMLFRIHGSADLSSNVFAVYNASKTYVGCVNIGARAKVAFTTSTGIIYYSLSISDFGLAEGADAHYIVLCVNASSIPEVHCR